MILERQEREGWGTSVIPRLAADLKNELPEEKGFSERNLKYMIRLAREYGSQAIVQRPVAQLEQSFEFCDKSNKNESSPILQHAAAKLDRASSEMGEGIDNKLLINVPQPVAKLPEAASPLIVQQVVAQLPWGHNINLFEKIKELPTRLWYARQALEQGCSRDFLTAQIKNRVHERQGGAVTNF